jgi:hypothetical protein
MYQLILLIHTSVDLVAFDQKWPCVLKVIEKMPGLLEESISRIYSFLFQDRDTLEDSLLTKSGEKAGQMIHDLTDGGVTILTGEYQEDTIENIQSHLSNS